MVGRSFMKGDSCCVLVLQLRVRCAGHEPSEKAAIPRYSIDCSHVDNFSPDLIWPVAITHPIMAPEHYATSVISLVFAYVRT